jgi:tetratricopeptide (TPR) repeat protein
MTKIPLPGRRTKQGSLCLMLSASFVAQTALVALAADGGAQTAAAAQSQSPATVTAPAATTTPPASAPAALPAVAEDDANSVKPDATGKAIWKKGQTLSVDTDVEDIQPTDDINIATKQMQAYPDSPEASFIYAVNLTRTSRVEEALKEVRRARKLAEGKGGHAYFDKMIETYEVMLKNFPQEDRVRYHLAWAYYMKAYLIAKYSKRSALWKKANPELAAKIAAAQAAQAQGQGQAPAVVAAASTAPAAIPSATPVSSTSATAQTTTAQPVPPPSTKPDTSNIGKLLGAVAGLANGTVTADKLRIPSALESCEPQDAPEVKRYYDAALMKLDEMLSNKPHDVWAIVYRAHLKAEYTGNLEEAMTTWRNCKQKYPNNPASYFFLGEGYLRQGNLKESLNHVSKAVALRALGN